MNSFSDKEIEFFESCDVLSLSIFITLLGVKTLRQIKEKELSDYDKRGVDNG